MIKFRCSNCNKKFGVPDDYAGRRIRCNTCNQHTIVPKSTLDADRVAATDQREVDGSVSPNPAPSLAANDKPAELIFKLQPDSSDDELITAETLLNTQKSADAEIQLQSFHDYSPPASETEESSTAKPTAKKPLTETLKRSRPDPKIDRTELTLNVLSYISCIGPVLFIFMFFYFMIAMATGDSPRARAAHHTPLADPNIVSTSDPNTVSTPDSTSILPRITALKVAFIAFAFVISPIALIGAMFIVLKYCYDMPKLLYFSIVIHGLIFFNIFRG